MTNPRIYRTLMAEIDEALSQGKIPSGATEVISDVQGKQLRYLQACIKEVGEVASYLGDRETETRPRVFDGILL